VFAVPRETFFAAPQTLPLQQDTLWRAACNSKRATGTSPREAAMQSWMEVAFLVEAGLFTGVLALFLVWLGMRVVFTLMPATPRAVAARATQSFPQKSARAA